MNCLSTTKLSKILLQHKMNVAKMNATVFILILNWDGWQDTIECVESCQKLNCSDFRIIVVDNGSNDDSVALLRKHFPQLALIETGKNLGFAGGNNVGIRYAVDHGAEYVWLLNNDTIIDPAALGELLKMAESESSIGMVGSKIMKYSEPEIIDFAKGRIDFHTGRTRHIGRGEKDVGQYDELSETDYITGCSLFIKKEVLGDIGLMPEEYFLYYEETDWCLQARRKGYKICIAPHSKVFHKVHSSTQKNRGAYLYYITRNRLFFLEQFGENIKWKRRLKTDWKPIKSIFSADFFSAIRNLRYVLKAYLHWLLGFAGAMEFPHKHYASIRKRRTLR